MTAALKNYYLDLMGISHRSYFPDNLVTLRKELAHWSKETKIRRLVAGSSIENFHRGKYYRRQADSASAAENQRAVARR